MDESSLMNGNKPVFEYNAEVSSSFINGESKMIISEEGLNLMNPFGVFEILYADIAKLVLENYKIEIQTSLGIVFISRLGSFCEPFYNELCEAYNQKVLASMFINGKQLFETKGEYRFEENGNIFEGRGNIRIYESCVVILPSDETARRIPLCFVSDIERKEFQFTLFLTTGECYTLFRLGYDSEPFEQCITKQLIILQKESLEKIQRIDSKIGAMQAPVIARLMMEGRVVSIAELKGVAPMFVTALEGRVSEGNAPDSYRVLKEFNSDENIYVGRGRATAFDKEELLWLAVLGRHKDRAIVEFVGGEDMAAATFCYQFEGDGKSFIQNLGRALEAISYRREVIRLTEEELAQREHMTDRMAVSRTAALRFVRKSFDGRIIHSSIDNWKREIMKYLE